MSQMSHFRIRSAAGSKGRNPIARFYWQMDLTSQEREIRQELIPSPFVDLIFPLERGLTVNGSNEVASEPFLSPVLTERKELTFLKGCCLFGIRLEAVEASALLDCAPSEIAQAPNDLGSVLRRRAREAVISAIYNADSFEERVAGLDRYFAGESQRKRTNSTESCRLAVDLIKREPHAKVGDICDRSGYSARWIEKIFQENLGCPPKKVIRIVRLNRFLESLKFSPSSTLTELAHEAGYYDQSHLVREFRNFSGLSPSEFGRNYPQFVKIMNQV